MKILSGKWILMALLALGGMAQAFGATYFVNSNGGNDNNDGTQPTWTSGYSGPWQTLAKLANVVLAPNDTVYLACGGVWNETLKVPSSGAVNVPIAIAAGPGNCTTPPLIDGAVTIPAHQWAVHSGSIYKAKLPIDLIANPTPTTTTTGWTQYSPTGDASLVVDSACPNQSLPCLALTSGGSSSIAISNNFQLAGGVEYSVGLQLRAPAGTMVKVVVRRGGPTYERLAPDQWVSAAGVWQSIGFLFRAPLAVPNARLDVEVPAGNVRTHIREAHVRSPFRGGEALVSYVDGLQVRRAHHPNFGQSGDPASPYATVASDGGKSTLDTSGLALPPGASIVAGMGVSIRTNNWAIEEQSIAGVVGSKITLAMPNYYDVRAGFGYFLTGALWMLDSPGEWFFDAPNSTLYLWMPDGLQPGNRVAVSDLKLGADLAGKSNILLSGVAIRHSQTGVAMAGAGAAVISDTSIADISGVGVHAENCRNCTVQRGSLYRTGLDAVSVPGAGAIGFSLLDSVIGESGISTRVDGWRQLPRPSKAAVYSIGPRSSVLRNRIVNSAGPGVYLGPYGVVEDNYVGQSCVQLNDCGGIYTNYLGNPVSIQRNLVNGVVGNLSGVPILSPSHAIGIYVDDRAQNATIAGNTVVGADIGIQMHNASASAVTANMLGGNRRYQLWLQEQTSVIRAGGDIFGNTVQGNTFVPTGGGPAVYLESELGDTVDFAAFSENHYSAILTPRPIGEKSPTTGASFSVPDWLAAGRELNARMTAPTGYAQYLVGANSQIPNGNLASGLTGWTAWNLTLPKISVAVRTCSFGPCLESVAGGSPGLVSSPNFSVVGGQWYRVAFDAAASQDGQVIAAVVRRGGGGTANYEYLMPAAESFKGTVAWRRYAFVFQATKTVTVNDPLTRELGARVDFERVLPGSRLSIANLELVTLTPAQAAMQVKVLTNDRTTALPHGCATAGISAAACSQFLNFSDDTPVVWPLTVNVNKAIAIYSRDVSLTDSDGDGIADQQDACPNTTLGSAVNARGCALGQ